MSKNSKYLNKGPLIQKLKEKEKASSGILG